MVALEIQSRLKPLLAERLLASNQGLAGDRADMADLDEQIPSGVTIDDYRRSRSQRRSRRVWLRIRPRVERRCCSRTPAPQNPADADVDRAA